MPLLLLSLSASSLSSSSLLLLSFLVKSIPPFQASSIVCQCNNGYVVTVTLVLSLSWLLPCHLFLLLMLLLFSHLMSLLMNSSFLLFHSYFLSCFMWLLSLWHCHWYCRDCYLCYCHYLHCSFFYSYILPTNSIDTVVTINTYMRNWFHCHNFCFVGISHWHHDYYLY